MKPVSWPKRQDGRAEAPARRIKLIERYRRGDVHFLHPWAFDDSTLLIDVEAFPNVGVILESSSVNRSKIV